MTGIVAALHAVVIMRGYSRIWGETSAEMHTGTPSSPLQVLCHRPLVGRVDVGVEEADGDRLRPHGLDVAGEGVEVGLGRRREDPPIGRGPLHELERPVPGHRGLRELDLQVVHVVPVLVADEQGVAEAARRHERRPARPSLDQRVGDERGGVDDGGRDLARPHAGLGQQRGHAAAHALQRRGRGRQRLVDHDPSRRGVQQDDVGERAADVHGEPPVAPLSPLVAARAVHPHRPLPAARAAHPSLRRSSRGGAKTSRIQHSPYSSSPMKTLSPCHTSRGAR